MFVAAEDWCSVEFGEPVEMFARPQFLLGVGWEQTPHKSCCASAHSFHQVHAISLRSTPQYPSDISKEKKII